jgi:hypothetical protein
VAEISFSSSSLRWFSDQSARLGRFRFFFFPTSIFDQVTVSNPFLFSLKGTIYIWGMIPAPSDGTFGGLSLNVLVGGAIGHNV